MRLLAAYSTASTALLRMMGSRNSSSAGIDASSPVVQRVYDILRAMGDPLEEAAKADSSIVLKQVAEVVASMTPSDVGVTTEDTDRLWRRPICMSVAEGKEFDMTVFFLPKGGKLPLHDHPRMAVLTKLLKGRLRLRSFDRESQDAQQEAGRGRERRRQGCRSIPARLSRDEVLDAESASPWMLTPSRGNIHELTAETPCLIFDVLLPPYDWGVARPCRYYNVTSKYSSMEPHLGEKVALDEVPEPAGLPARVPYAGPIVDEEDGGGGSGSSFRDSCRIS